MPTCTANVVNERLHVDPAALDAIGRMGGHGYATTRDFFDLPTMSVEHWQSRCSALKQRP